ncbi:MAG: ATPase, T2SS/T4P/T4SS family [Sandaracinaceae bacterium]|nr:ATPase, T2SS/T4P/T4SS family [Sandaracinaceae bacterium]
MKRIDFYLQHLVRHNANAIVLASGQPVLFRLTDGERKSNTPIDHAQVAHLVQESAPPTVFDDLRAKGQGAYDYTSDAGVRVHVDIRMIGGREWEVIIAPTDAAGPAARPAAVVGVVAPTPEGAPEPARARAPEVRAVAGEPALNRMLRLMVQLEASDLHVCTGVVPMVRLHGEMQPLEERGPFSEEELSKLLLEIVPARNREEFEQTSDTDFAHTIPEVARFRVNYFRDRKGIGGVFRQIPFEILPPEKLGIPSQVLELCYLTKGLVLVTGPTGSGKSTTLATLIDVVNQRRADHIITIEDPIEFVHKNKRCLVNQREVGTHTQGFEGAARRPARGPRHRAGR